MGLPKLRPAETGRAGATGLVLAVVLAAGVGLVALSAAGPGTPTAVAAPAPAVPAAAAPGGARTVTLPTGDRVTVSPGGSPAVTPAKGRKDVSFLVSRVNGHLHVVPDDALPMLRSGQVDRGRFDVTALLGDDVDDRRALREPAAAAEHDLTLVHTARDGRPATDHETMIYGLDGDVFEYLPGGTASTTLRLPAGRYAVATRMLGTSGDRVLLAQPELDLSVDRTVRLDARLGRRVSVQVPRPSATALLGYVSVHVPGPGGGFSTDVLGRDLTRVYTAQIGPARAIDGVLTQVGGVWGEPGDDGEGYATPYAYRLAYYLRGRVATGFTRTVRPADLATVRADYGVTTPGTTGLALPYPFLPDVGGTSNGFSHNTAFPLPFTRTEYYNTEPGVRWQNSLLELGADGRPVTSVVGGTPAYRAGRSYTETWNRGVFGPSFADPLSNPNRTGDTLRLAVPLYSDAPDRWGGARSVTGTVTLHRDGVLVGEAATPGASFTVPPEAGTYRARIDASRATSAPLTTRTIVDWTFRSARADGATPVPLPLLTTRFTPRLDRYNGAPAGATFPVPVTVHRQPGPPAAAIRTLRVDVSYDDGRTWALAPLVRAGDKGLATVSHPAGAGYVSLRAAATDAAGNAVEQTVIRAYRLVP